MKDDSKQKIPNSIFRLETLTLCANTNMISAVTGDHSIVFLYITNSTALVIQNFHRKS